MTKFYEELAKVIAKKFSLVHFLMGLPVVLFVEAGLLLMFASDGKGTAMHYYGESALWFGMAQLAARITAFGFIEDAACEKYEED